MQSRPTITAYLKTGHSSELDLLHSFPSPSTALLYHLPVATANQIPNAEPVKLCPSSSVELGLLPALLPEFNFSVARQMPELVYGKP